MAQDPKLKAAFREVYKKTPSTVERANVSGKRKRAMLAAVAISKARAGGAKVPKRRIK